MAPSEAVRKAMKIHQEREAGHLDVADRMELELLRAFVVDTARGGERLEPRYTAQMILEGVA